VLLVLGAAPTGLTGQQRARYHQLTRFRTQLETPEGPLTIPTEHDAWITVERASPDSAQAWYDSIRVSADLPEGKVSPELGSLRGERFTLRIGPTGHVTTLARPDFPASLEGITDLQYQFTDFFPLLPGRPLRVGQEWADTLSTGATTSSGTSRSRKIVHYKVAADTTVDGRPVFTLEAASALENRSESAVPDRPGLRVRVLVLGTEHELAFVEADGTLIARRRSAQLGGTMTYVGGAAPVELRVVQGYDSEIRAVGP
jgi:hypothetical protein